jgi:hypothetical protein
LKYIEVIINDSALHPFEGTDITFMVRVCSLTALFLSLVFQLLKTYSLGFFDLFFDRILSSRLRNFNFLRLLRFLIEKDIPTYS